jgi:hypothetical protein
MSKNASPQFKTSDKKVLNPKGIYKPVGLDVYIEQTPKRVFGRLSIL